MQRMVFDILIVLLLFLIKPSGLVNAQIHSLDKREKIQPGQTIQVIYPPFRQWSKPAYNLEPTFNPPFFLWPLSEQDDVTYDIRLSSDENFNRIEYSGSDLPYAIYNPYRHLDTGEWFWQYRTNKGSWSKVHTFVISDTTRVWDLPAPHSMMSGIPEDHPRVLINKDQWEQFRYKTQHLKDAQIIIENAESQIKKPLIQEKLDLPKIQNLTPSRIKKLHKDASKKLGQEVFGVIGALCESYILTKDKKYVEKAKEWALEVASWNPEGVSSINDFADSRIMLSMALVYDTFFDQLTLGEKKVLLKAIQFRGDRFYNQWINKIEGKVLSNHVWQHILHYFFQTAVATYGEIPEADDWLEYVYELFLARAPVLGRDDGGWVNGNSYFTMNMAMLLDIPLTIKDLTGFNFIHHTKWYDNNPYYLWYSMPPHSSSDGFGDNSKGFSHPNAAYIAYADALSKVTNNPLALQYKIKSLQGTSIKVSDDHSLRWIRLKHLRNLLPPKPSTMEELTNARVFDEVGLVYMNSDLSNTSSNLMLAMRSSPFGSYGHMLADQNTFNILYGGRPLFYHSGHKISMNDPHRLGWYKHTKSHNGILINGHGQPYSTEAYGWIPRFIDGKNLSYAMGDASMAYNTISHGGKVDYGVHKFDRHIIMLYPDIIVIYDELQADHPANWSWALHSPFEIKGEQPSQTFYCNRGDVSSRISVFGSKNISWEITDEFDVPAENWRPTTNPEIKNERYEDGGWHLRGITDPTPKMQFLSVIQVGPDSEIMPLKSNVKGQIVCDEWIIDADLYSGSPSHLRIIKKDGQVAFTTGGDGIRFGQKLYKASNIGDALLVEYIDGKLTTKEASDQMPEQMKTTMKNLNSH